MLFLWPEVRPLSQPIRSRHGHEGDESRGGPSEGDARIAIVDGEASVEVHGEGVEGLGDEGQGAVVEGRGEVVEGDGAVVEGDEREEEESVDQGGEGHGCAAGWLDGDEGQGGVAEGETVVGKRGLVLLRRTGRGHNLGRDHEHGPRQADCPGVWTSGLVNGQGRFERAAR